MILSDYLSGRDFHYSTSSENTKVVDLAEVGVYGDIDFAEDFEYKKLTKTSTQFPSFEMKSISNALLLGRSMVIAGESMEIDNSSLLNGRFFCERKWVEAQKSGLKFSVKFVGNLEEKVEKKFQEKVCGFMLGNTGSYQHWFMEILPLAFFYQKMLRSGEIDCILINEDAPRYQLDIYKSLGIIENMSPVSSTTPYIIGNMRLATPLSVNSIWINPEIIDFFTSIKNLFVEKFGGQNMGGEKILIGRADLATKREIRNFYLIEKECVRRGYRVIYPEKLSFEEKINVFSSAERIIGQAGGGMSHLVFSDNLKSATILAPNNFPINSFREICSFKSIKCSYFLTESFDNFVGGKLDSNSYADFQKFKIMMNENDG